MTKPLIFAVYESSTESIRFSTVDGFCGNGRGVCWTVDRRAALCSRYPSTFLLFHRYTSLASTSGPVSLILETVDQCR